MLNDEIKNALETLRAGGVILYPTDTVWSLGCDATNVQAVEKIISLKQRAQNKSFIVLLDSENKLPSYVQNVPEIAYDLIEYAEKPLTIIYDNAKNLATNIVAEDGSIAIRIIKHDFCSALLHRFRKPIVSTSANISGENAPQLFSEINPEMFDLVDYVVDYEQQSTIAKPASTIMKLSYDGRFEFIRK